NNATKLLIMPPRAKKFKNHWTIRSPSGSAWAQVIQPL
ncbi:MAG: hypothetical protein ACI87Q_002117, partial [Pseudohongiellaceae bacterium]